jgi:predicted amidohydrolase
MRRVYQDTIAVACANVHQLPSDKTGDLTTFKNFIGEAANKRSNLIVFPEMALTAAGATASSSCEPIEDIHKLAETVHWPSTEELILVRTCALKGARLIALVTAVMVTIRDLRGNRSMRELWNWCPRS